jgi:hypothetical protein
MSLDITVYTRDISDDLIPKIQRRLNDFEMICEMYPEFSFKEQTGFLSFKFQLTNPPFEILRDKVLTSGFELYIDDFDLENEKARSRSKLGLFQKFLGGKIAEKPLVSDSVDKRLKDCTKMVSFVWHVADSFEVRFASLTSAILTELTNGVCTYSADNIWYDNESFVEKTWIEIKEYETTLLKEKDLKFREFDRWSS